MATITLNIPDTFIQRAIDAYLNDFNYQTQIPNPDFDPEQPEGEGNEKLIDNPETPAQFTKRMVGEEVKGRVLRYESGVARRQGIDTLKTEIESIEIT
jgi:hypothetical protein